MRALSDRLSGLSYVAAALVVACSVFPDEASLPTASGGSGSGSRAEGGSPASEGGADFGARAAAGERHGVPGGAAGDAGNGGSTDAEGGDGAGQGAGGAAPSTCADEMERSVAATLDLWLGALDRRENHGAERVLYVSGDPDQRRALFTMPLPSAPSGATLVRAEVALSLESNADASGAARRLGLYAQAPLHAVVENKATWEQYGPSKANQSWENEGGDLSEVVSTAELRAGTSRGAVRFDVTNAVRAALSAGSAAYGVVILEEGQAPAAPAELAFTSREGNASGSPTPAPTLLLRFCSP